MRDSDTRRRIERSTESSVLVEAAAGTGKTTLIVERILHGIRDGSLRLPETVAITFTEKAAGELEERLRDRLRKALHEPGIPEDERRRLRTAAGEIDRAHVSTIHAFCAGILREKPAEAGVDPEFTVLEQTGAALLREECWRDWIDAQVAEAPDVLVEALRAGIAEARLKELAAALAAAPEILELPTFELPRPEGDPGEILRQVGRSAEEAAEAFRRFEPKRTNKQHRALHDLAGQIARGAGAADLRRLAYAAAAVDTEKALRSFGEDAEEAGPPVVRFQEAARRLAAHLAAGVFQWLRGYLEHYRAARRSRSVLNFQDLLLLSARLLRQKPEVRRHFQHRFRKIFVDEFQDTDPLQAELIAYLCEKPGTGPARRLSEVELAEGRLTAVGDPKQSIYRFRRADVEVYEQFKALFGQDGVEQVFCNFRSCRPLLDWFNRLFEFVFQPPDAEGVYQAEHVPLEPGLSDVRAEGPAVACLCPAPGVNSSGWNAATGRAWEARHLARFVRDLVEGRLSVPDFGAAPAYADFAFLLRSFSPVDIYEDALDALGVPYRVIGGKHFYRRLQTEETFAVLRAVNDPLDQVATVAALRSSYFGISDEDLLRYRAEGGSWNYLRTEVRTGPVGEAMGLLGRWHRRRNLVAPQVLLGEIFDGTKAPQSYMLKPAGPQRAAALDQLRARLRSLARSARTFGAMIRHLSSIEEADLPEGESSAVEPGQDFVQLLTMHKAKGLEFPVVVLPDLGRRFPGKGRVDRLLFNRQDGRVGLRAKKGIETADYEGLRLEEHGNQAAELRRLFYVACTRARRLLVMPLHWWGRSSNSFLGMLEESGILAAPDEVPFGRRKDGVYYVDTRDWHETLSVGAQPRAVPRQDAGEVERQLAERRSWMAHHEELVERLSTGRRVVNPSRMDREFRPIVSAEQGPGRPAGKDVGSLFHRVMSAVPLGEQAELEEVVRGLAGLGASGPGQSEEVEEEAVRLALSALKAPEFVALLRDAGSVRREVGFSVPLSALPLEVEREDGLVEGSIDLLAETAGRTLVLDYKTDRTVEPERYWPQLTLYGLAAQACGLAEGQVELALFFVRGSELRRRELTHELVEQVAGLVHPPD